MVLALRLTPLSHLETCGTSVVYADANRSLVLKHYMLFTEHTPRERETCILQALQQFAWAPRWLCTGTDYMLSSFGGRPACRERIPSDYRAQVGTILAEMHSVGVRHNDLHKDKATDFMVDAPTTGRVALADFGWATINGTLAAQCHAHDGRLLVAKPSRPRSPELSRGAGRPETPDAVTLPRCRGMYDAHREAPSSGFIHPYTSLAGCRRRTSLPKASSPPPPLDLSNETRTDAPQLSAEARLEIADRTLVQLAYGRAGDRYEMG